MYLGSQVMVDLDVRPVEVFWRYHVGEATSDIVSNREVWISDKPMGSAECISVCLEGGVYDEAVFIFLFMVLE